MKIELWYDSVSRETDILINKVPVEKNDIFGFLYPVRNYPFQSWLLPIGSWKGLEYQIKDLSRNEDVELIFHGRKCDYTDLEKCLSKSEKIKLYFENWDACKKYDELLLSFLNTLKSNHSFLENTSSDLQLPIVHTGNHIDSVPDWEYHIYNDSDLIKANDTENKRCYCIHESFFTAYDKLEELLSVTRSLKVPADAIYCCFGNEEEKNNYKYYAKSFKRMTFNFGVGDTYYKEDAYSKYGHPFEIKAKLKACVEDSRLLCSDYHKAKELTNDIFNNLSKNINCLDEEEKKLFEKTKQLRLNADIFALGMKKVIEYTDVLFSVSKNDKNEALHYECIDKLEEIINLYLTPNLTKGSELK